jgi:hypothetical protein
VPGARLEVDPRVALLNGERLGEGVQTLKSALVETTPGRVRIETRRRDVVVVQRVGDWLNLAVFLDERRRGRGFGLLGDGDPANDLVNRDGLVGAEPLTRAYIEGVLAHTWRISPEESLFTYENGETTADQTYLDYPRPALDPARLSPEARAAGEAACDAVGDVPPEVRASCVVDVACTGETDAARASTGMSPRRVPLVTDAETAAWDDDGERVVVRNGPLEDPTFAGCADGQREGLIDRAGHPDIAGCLGSWSDALSLRPPRAGGACGDDLGRCTSPADLCAPGWRVCGATGRVDDLTRLDAQACREAGAATDSAALSHCASNEGCEYDADTSPCTDSGWCSEAICRGERCTGQGVCIDGLWPGQTFILSPDGEGRGASCGAVTGRRTHGVVCCRE